MARLGHRGGIRVLLLGAAIVSFVIPAAPAEAASTCATPGRDGTATLNSVINTYYPGTLTAAAGATTITLGAATGAATPIAVGDLVLVIQMQDAAINSTNTGAYGNAVAGDPASGWTGLNSAGLYEYAAATSVVPLAGGGLTISSGLLNTYTHAVPTLTEGQRDFQVIRVPQYVAATLAGGLTAGAFNGSTGGVLVFDVDGALNLNGAAVSVSQEGFRAGLGRQLTGGAGGTGTDYVNLSASNFHGQKGEGIAGTPQYVFDSRTAGTVNNLVDGYPNGSTARGAPATAGGGGTDPHPSANDQNTGGGGGANGGAGGMGGNSWSSNLAMGGFGGTAFPATAARVTAGAGGGAGTRNNASSANASSGGNGGAIVMIRTGSVTGTGTITTDGGTGIVPLNDGGGGGGAGGTVVVVTQTGALAGLTVNARGGAGANAWPADAGGAADYHGPGGGGGGGVVLSTSALGTVNVNGGINGTTTTNQNAFGATPGALGSQATITANQIPGASSGAECTPDLTLTKSHADPFVRGSAGTYTLTVSNAGGSA
ncbi:MAG: isopeptide-forming domain-containing fimbrial protein, partial [Chloroflexi bacterium]